MPTAWIFYRRLLAEAPKYLKAGGYLAVEIGYDQAKAVTELAKTMGVYSEVVALKRFRWYCTGLTLAENR